jgi:Orn/Lys/Arg decarboxylase, major domain
VCSGRPIDRLFDDERGLVDYVASLRSDLLFFTSGTLLQNPTTGDDDSPPGPGNPPLIVSRAYRCLPTYPEPCARPSPRRNSFWRRPRAKTEGSAPERPGAAVEPRQLRPVGVPEANAARIFRADQTYFVLNGASTTNRVVTHSCVAAGDVVLADRNCYKSVS